MEKRKSHAFNLLYYLKRSFPVACAFFLFSLFFPPSIFLCISNFSVYSKAPLKACFPKCDQNKRYLFHLMSLSCASPLFCRPKVNYPTYNLLTVRDNHKSESMRCSRCVASEQERHCQVLKRCGTYSFCSLKRENSGRA